MNRCQELRSILAAWLFLSLIVIFLARPNRSAPGLYYDEIHSAGMARDFLTGHARLHLPGCKTVSLFGRPFPTFVQPYGGAVKSWLLLPEIGLFGASQAVVRMSAVAWSLVALLLFMLWAWQWLGRNVALLAGALLAFDPSYFFVTVLDWGPVLPSFLCRFACFWFGLRWWRLAQAPGEPERKLMPHAFLAGFFAGLGFFNKIDFAVLLAGVILAVGCVEGRALWRELLVRRSVTVMVAGLGFLLAAAPMLPHLPQLLTVHVRGSEAYAQTEMADRLNTLLAMLDGSYFYRLMNAGGVFDSMFKSSVPVFAPLGLGFLLAAAYFIVINKLHGQNGRQAAMVLLSVLFITIGLLVLPKSREVRIHHTVSIYPFPHLAVAMALRQMGRWRWMAGVFGLLLALELHAIDATQAIIRRTSGRGWWSDAITAFAREVNGQTNLVIVSLDWGFNEQLAFLTDGPKLAEPFWWGTPRIPGDTNIICLAYPPEYSRFPYGPRALEDARRSGPEHFEVRPWRDHENNIAFYSIQFRKR